MAVLSSPRSRQTGTPIRKGTDVRRALLGWWALAALLIFPVTETPAADISWTIQSFQGADGIATKGLIGLAERLNDRTGGRLAIEVLPAGGSVPNDETPRAINAGFLHGHYSTPSYFARIDPAFAVLGDTLSAYRDPAERDGWFADGGGLALTRKLYAKNGLYFIGPVYWPADWMPSMVPLDGVADLEALRIRSPGGLVGDLLRKAGADVVQLPTGQIQNALESGEIDATDWAHVSLNQTSGLYDVAPYNVQLRHSMVMTEISVGLTAWEALPDDLKPLVEAEVQAFSRLMQNVFAEEEARANEALARAGVTVIEWDEAEADPFRAMLVDVWQGWRTKSAFAAEVIDSHIAYLEKIGQT